MCFYSTWNWVGMCKLVGRLMSVFGLLGGGQKKNMYDMVVWCDHGQNCRQTECPYTIRYSGGCGRLHWDVDWCVHWLYLYQLCPVGYGCCQRHIDHISRYCYIHQQYFPCHRCEYVQLTLIYCKIASITNRLHLPNNVTRIILDYLWTSGITPLA